MPDNVIRIEGFEEALRKIKSLEQLQGVKAAMRAAAVHVQGKIVADVPPQPHRPQPFVSDKSRRWFFANLRAGTIDVPYRRSVSPGSESLSKKWSIGERDGGMTQIIGTNASYGPFVQDKERQTKYHKETGWKTIQDVAAEESDTVVKFVQKEIDRILEKG